MEKYLKYLILYFFMMLTTFSCGDNVILSESLRTEEVAAPVPSTTSYVSSGDIFIISGGTVATTASPYPIHNITQWSASGTYIRTIASSPSASTFYFGGDIDPSGSSLYFSIDTVDRIDKVNLSTLVTTTHVIDASLTGTTMRSLAVLSDGGVIAAESTTSVEKFDSAGARVTTNFPLTFTANINSLKRISGNRFVALFSGNPDNPKVYNNDGTLAATISGLGCTTNCDPYDIIELSDGRFVISLQLAAYQSLELFDSSFNYVGQLYKNTTYLSNPGPMALLKNGDIIVCSTVFNTCEEITISGNTGTRVGSRTFIADASLMRQPTAIMVAP